MCCSQRERCGSDRVYQEIGAWRAVHERGVVDCRREDSRMSGYRTMSERSVGLGLWLVCAVVALGACAGCSSTGIAVREKLGYAKREQLVDRVEDARDSQEEAKEQFASALDEFLAVTRAEAGELEDRYRDAQRSYERSESRADKVRGRIRDVERVAAALFEEWEDELDEFSSDSLRRRSERTLDETRGQYERLIGVMREAAGKMDPVLAALKDQVLFLKHNLNARAIASLGETTRELQTDVAALIRDMEASIREANSFIEQLRREEE